MDDYNYNENDGGQSYTPAPKNGFGTAALLFGISALFGSMTIWFGIIFGIAAIVCAAISRVNIGRFDAKSGAGLVLGIIFLIMSLLLFYMVLQLIQNPELLEQLNEMMQQYEIEYQ